MSHHVVFVHGMFVTPRCWALWQEHFEARGYQTHAPAWPGRDAPVEQLREAHPNAAVGELTLEDVVERFADYVKGLDRPPLLVGHSMGGLVVQLLLQRGLGAAGVAIDSAPPKGVLSLRWSFLKSNWPVLNPFVPPKRPYLMPFEHFRYTFVHTLSSEAQRQAYEAHVVPESRQVGRAALTPAAKIDFSRPHAPLLFVTGEEDRIIPPSLNRTNAAKYRHPESVVELQALPGRTHYIIGQEGWEEVADAALAWGDAHLPRAEAPQAQPQP